MTYTVEHAELDAAVAASDWSMEGATLAEATVYYTAVWRYALEDEAMHWPHADSGSTAAVHQLADRLVTGKRVAVPDDITGHVEKDTGER